MTIEANIIASNIIYEGYSREDGIALGNKLKRQSSSPSLDFK